MPATLNATEEAQLAQTIEMFEVITQSQPHDYQSLEILKEAYAKIGRETEATHTAKRIAQAYFETGQLSSAILEYETILQRYPNDPDVKRALSQIESKASKFAIDTSIIENPSPKNGDKPRITPPRSNGEPPAVIDDGRKAMYKVFVETKVIGAGEFDLCWTTPPPGDADVSEPFIQVLADKDILPIEKSLKLLSDKSRTAFLPLNSYETDMDLARNFPRTTCRRWCILPFDRMSKSIFVATANPFNKQAAQELSEVTQSRLLWYLVPPVELVKLLRRVFR